MLADCLEQIPHLATHFCEAARCDIIRQPATTWSNLAYVVVGGLLFVAARRYRGTLAWWLAPVTATVGIGSLVHHWTLTFTGQVLDYGSMYMLTALLSVLSLRRIRPATASRTLGWMCGASVGVSISLLCAVKHWTGESIGILIFA
ncbi:MAG: ceramidase domain-containing protein, partial [Patescibacteria group bacterium]